MAIYSTFFLCDRETLPLLFPGWRPPRDVPVVREVKNPFTGEMTRVSSREPDWPDDASDTPLSDGYQLIRIEGNYEQYLEARLAPEIRGRPHWCTKGLMEDEMAELGAAAGVEPALDVALYAPPRVAATLAEMHRELVLQLAAADGRRLAEIASCWGGAMSMSDYVRTVPDDRTEGDPACAYEFGVIEAIAALARRASSDERLYLLMEA